jgi:hypothetical protein
MAMFLGEETSIDHHELTLICYSVLNALKTLNDINNWHGDVHPWRICKSEGYEWYLMEDHNNLNMFVDPNWNSEEAPRPPYEAYVARQIDR